MLFNARHSNDEFKLTEEEEEEELGGKVVTEELMFYLCVDDEFSPFCKNLDY